MPDDLTEKPIFLAMTKRIYAAGVDFLFIVIISSFASYLNLSYHFFGTDFFFGQFIMPIFFALFISKDSLNGRSPGKRIFGLQVLQNSTNQPISPIKAIIRNFFWLIWPVELIMTLLKPHQRIGDRVTGSRVDLDTGIRNQEPGKSVVAFFIAFVCMFVILQVISPASTGMARYRRAAQENDSTYNKKLSDEITRLYVDSLGKYLVPEAAVYEEPAGKFYVTVIFKLKADFLSSPEGFRLLNLKHQELLSTKLEKGSYSGKATFEYSEFGNYESRETPIH